MEADSDGSGRGGSGGTASGERQNREYQTQNRIGRGSNLERNPTLPYNLNLSAAF